MTANRAMPERQGNAAKPLLLQQPLMLSPVWGPEPEAVCAFCGTLPRIPSPLFSSYDKPELNISSLMFVPSATLAALNHLFLKFFLLEIS